LCLIALSSRVSVLFAVLLLFPFPTRRSSDLVVVHVADAHDGGHDLPARPDDGARAAEAALPVAAVQVQRDPAPGDERRAAVGQRDRKSTRLNSSHVKISYAVFCLKKKK